jgi:hypothetical protein
MLTDDGQIELLRWEIARGALLRFAWLRDSQRPVIAFRWRGPRLVLLYRRGGP